PRAGRESFPPPRGRRDRARPTDRVPPLARSRRPDWSPAQGPRRPGPPSQSRSWQRAPHSAPPWLHASRLPPRPPPLQLDFALPPSARPRLAQWRRRQSAPQGSEPEPCSPKCALNGGRSSGHSPKIPAGPRDVRGPTLRSSCHPGANLTWIRPPRQQLEAVITDEFGRFWPVAACLLRVSQFFSQQLLPDYNAVAFPSDVSASSPSESSLR